jgi:4'-phosphopantetheinyl transferase
MELPRLDAHVWLVSLDVPPERRALLGAMLSADERERARRYRVPGARERFVAARGTLREVLGRYSGLPPDRLRFSYPCVCGRADCVPARRKPRLELEAGRPPLRFNLSHTAGLAMVAVSVGCELGVDAERIRPGTAIEPIAERVLGADDVAALRALPAAQRVEAFYRRWTRREAYVKARGDGLAPRADSDREDAAHWWSRDLPAPPGYAAALVVEGGARVVRTGWWPPERNGHGGPLTDARPLRILGA